jgi:hypothetical protein
MENHQTQEGHQNQENLNQKKDCCLETPQENHQETHQEGPPQDLPRYQEG